MRSKPLLILGLILIFVILGIIFVVRNRQKSAVLPPVVHQSTIAPALKRSAILTSPTGPVQFGITPNSGNFKVGETVDLQIMMDTGHDDVGGLDLNLQYNKNVLEMNGFSSSDIFNDVVVNGPPDNKAGSFHLAVGNYGGNKIVGTVSLGTAHFKAQEAGAAKVTLIPLEVAVNSNPPVDVKAASASATYIIGSK